MAFKFTLLSDVRAFLKGTSDVETELDKVADSLDDLARETAQNADEASAQLEREFSTAFDKVRADAKTAGDDVGDHMKHGTDEASEGTRTFKENAQSNAKEVAASFDGSAQSIADGFQGLAAEAFEGFGPAGVAAGVAAGAGLGLISKAFEDADERAEEIKEKIADLRDQLNDLDGDVTQLDFATEFRTWGEEMDGQVKKIDQLRQMSATLGVDYHTLYLAWTGDEQAKQAVLDATAVKQKEINDLQAAGDISDSLRQRSTDLRENVTLLGEHAGWIDQASAGLSVYNDFIGDTATKTAELSEAQRDAESAAETFSQSLTDNLSVADEGLDKFVKKGKLKLSEWTDALNARAEQNTRIKDFTVDVDTKLSPEALENFEKLPTETQAQIAEAYDKAGGKGKKQIIKNLEAEAKVEKVTVDTSAAQTAADSTPIEIPTTIDSSATAAQATKAAEAAQQEANRTANEIEFTTKIDRDELQRQVDRAALSITPPTITVKTKVQKEVP